MAGVCKAPAKCLHPFRRKILQNILLYTAGQSCFPHNPLLDRNCRKDGMTYRFSPPHHVHASLPTAPPSTNTGHRLNQQRGELAHRLRVPGQPHPNSYQAARADCHKTCLHMCMSNLSLFPPQFIYDEQVSW